MKLSTDKIKKIGVFRALQLGDMLCTVPALKALRNAYPEAEIILLGLPWAKSFASRFDRYLDGHLHFPGYPGLPEQDFDAAKFVSFSQMMLTERFDLILQMQGNGTLVNPMLELFGAAYTAGFRTNGHYAPDDQLFLNYPDHGSEIERHLALMQHLGINSLGTDLEFPLTDRDYNDLAYAQLGLEGQRYVCIHPGSRGSWRQWPTTHFAALADHCIAQGFSAVITGTNEELNIVEAVIGHMKNVPINAAGRTSLGAMGVLIKDASLLISNCTGVSHMASAFRTPSVVISMDGEPQRWGPLDTDRHRTINWLTMNDFDEVLRQTADLIRQAA